MKRTAIVTLLWSTQFEALRQFLLMHEPMVVIAVGGSMNLDMQAAVTSTGCMIIWLDSVLDGAPAGGVGAEAAHFEQAFARFLAANRPIAGFPEQGARETLSTVISERLKADLLPALQMLESLQRASETFDISLLATNEDATGACKIATAWAKFRGVPTLHLSHSIALFGPYTVHDQLMADKLAVFGRRGMEGYLDIGIPEERMVLTGNPAWDCYVDLRTRKSACREHLDRKYQLKPNLPLVVFGTTWSANLSAHCNEDIFVDSIAAFFGACGTLKKQGIEFNAVVKDRASNAVLGEKTCAEILAALSPGGDFFYAADDTQFFAAAADVLVAVDSNYLVEGMLADTAVVNLLNATGILMGPSFEAETGILEVEAEELADAVRRLLTDPAAKSESLQMIRQRVGYYNHGFGDGQAAVRVAQAMASMAPRLRRRAPGFVWQRYLDVESAEVTDAYHTVGRADLAAMYSNHPSLILDVGCAAGSTAALIKQRFPGSRAWGIEMNRAAASLAREKLDRVLVGRFEDFDLEKEGIAKGTLDAVLLADVLEHMYNPWSVLVNLHPFLSPGGQMVLSIPNVRNLLLMEELSKGNWTYAGEGLLDITHIRFFTFKEILRMCGETGYRVISTRGAIDSRLGPFLKQHENLAQCDINTDRMTLKRVSRDELIEFCTIQFYFLLEKDAAAQASGSVHRGA